MLEDIHVKDYSVYYENFTCGYIVEYKKKFLCKKDTLNEAIQSMIDHIKASMLQLVFSSGS